MKKFFFVSANESAPWGASEELWYQTAIRIVNQKLTVVANVKAWKPDPEHVKKLEESQCIVVRRAYKNFAYRPVYEIPESETFSSSLDKFKPDLVVISQGDNYEGLGWMEECQNKKIRYVTITHSATESEWLPDKESERLLKGYQNATRCFFVSQSNLKLTEKQIACPLFNSKIVRVPFKVSYDADILWPSNEVFKLACVARLDPATKGQDILFEVLRFNKWINRPIQVTLFGDGYHRRILKDLSNLWKLDNVKFSGFVNNIEDIWKNHHALILPSRVEGLPTVIIEAMLCGRVCIVTDVAGNTEVLEDNISGFVAKAPKVEFLDEAMERAWHKRDSWYDIGQVAAKKIRTIIPRDPVGLFAEELKSLI